MKRLVIGCALLMVSFLCGTAAVLSAPKEWRVSLSREAGTYASLEAARDAIRAYREEHEGPEAHTVVLDDGKYALSRTFELAKQDSGSAGCPMTYRARSQGRVFISTAPEIPAGRFRPATEEERSRLSESARAHVLVAELKEDRLVRAFGRGQGDYGLLTCNEHVLQLAQWPNHAYNLIGKVIDMGPTLRWLQTGENPEPFSYDKPCGGKFTTKEPADFSAWRREHERTRDIEQDGFLSCDWMKDANMVGRISDDGVIQLLDSTRYGIGGIRYRGGFRNDSDKPRFKKNRRILFRNLLCELDMPGEWYFDRDEKKLYLWPIDASLEQATIAVPSGPPMGHMTGTDYVNVEGIVFENGGDQVLVVEGGSHNRIAGCTFRNLRGRVGALSGCNNGFLSCDFYNMDSCMTVTGGDCSSLTRAGNYLINCDFHDFRAMGYGAIRLDGCGILFKNNLYHRISSGIHYSGMYIEFINSEFFDAGWGMGDWNVIYQGADFWCNGNLVENNFFHHMFEHPTVYGITAARNDDGGSGTTYKRNVFYKTGSGAVTFAGPNSHLLSNIALDCTTLWRTNKRALTPDEIEAEYEKLRVNFESGKYPRGAKEDRLYKAERVVGKEGWNREPFKSAFPNFPKYMNENPFSQAYGSMLNNYCNFLEEDDPYGVVYIHGSFQLTDDDGGVKHANKMVAGLPATFRYNAPRRIDRKRDFVDYKTLNFELRPEFLPMPGFEPCSFAEIGLYEDRFRPNPPRKDEYRGALYRRNRFRASTSSGLAYGYRSALRYYPVRSWQDDILAEAAEFPYLSGVEDSGATVHVALRRDMSSIGETISLNGRKYDYGLTACPPARTGRSEVLFDLAPWPRVTGLTATVGIDDAVGNRGSCVFIVEGRSKGRWKKLFKSSRLTGKDDGVEISVDLRGCDALKLVATDGGDGIQADHAVWADARFTIGRERRAVDARNKGKGRQ